MVTFSLKVNAPTDSSIPVSALTADFDQAASDWASYLNSNANIRVQIDFGFPAGLEMQNDPTTFVPIGSGPDGTTLVESWGLYALTTGSHVPGSPYDVHILVTTDPSQLAAIYFNPDPAAGGPVPAGEYDAVSLFLRELAYGLGFDTMTTTNADAAAGLETALDRYVQTSPGGYTANIGPDLVGEKELVGPATEAAYGGPVPLVTPEPGYNEANVHVGNTPTLAGSTDLMGVTQNVLGQSLSISPLDLAIMQDAGVPIVTATTGTLYFADAGTTVTSTGVGDTIVGAGASGSPAATVFGTGSQALVFGGAGPMELILAGSGDKVIGGSGAETIFGAASGLYFLGSSSSLFVGNSSSSSTIVGTTGNELVFGGAGAQERVFANNSALVFAAGSGDAATVVGGSDVSTLFGSAGSAITYFGVEAGAVYAAGSGNETLSAAGSGSGSIIFGGQDPAGGDSLVGASGNDALLAGSGADTLSAGGGGGDHFVFIKGAAGGVDVIQDFQASDALLLFGYGANAGANALASATVSGGATTIALSDNTRITFQGVSDPGSIHYYSS